MGEFLYKELSYEIIGCCYSVRNKYGMNHKEGVFHRALEEEFESRHIKYVLQPKIKIYSLNTGKVIGIYNPDDLVENKIIIEIKASQFTTKQMEMQLCEYLKTSEYEIGFLVNFGKRDFKPEKYIYTNNRKSFLNKVEPSR